MSQDSTTYIDHLDEDKPLNRQNYFCVSFLSPEGIKNCSMRGLKIRGVYENKQDADKRAEELRNVDPYFHVFVGEVGKWLPWDPDVNTVEDNKYAEQELNDLMKGYKDNQDKISKMEEQRKQDMLKNAANREENNKNSKKKKKKKNKNNNVNNDKINNNDDDKVKKLLENKEKLLNNERLKLNKNEDVINKETEDLNDIDSKLKNIKNLYQQLKNKN